MNLPDALTQVGEENLLLEGRGLGQDGVVGGEGVAQVSQRQFKKVKNAQFLLFLWRMMAQESDLQIECCRRLRWLT